MQPDVRVWPPVPAPYLAEVPQLDREQLDDLDTKRPSPAAMAEARRTVARLRRLIRQARERFEAAEGVVIVPEPTWMP